MSNRKREYLEALARRLLRLGPQDLDYIMRAMVRLRPKGEA